MARRMKLVLMRLNFLEWRLCLQAEARWSGVSLQVAHKAWKLQCMSFPSRDGDDRRGGRGSPLEPEDELKADEELLDERLIKRASAYSLAEYGTGEPGASMMRAELQRPHAQRRAVEAKQQAVLAAEAEQKAGERMRELKELMRARAEPPELPEPVEEQAEPGEADGAAAAAAAEEQAEPGEAAAEPAAPPPPQADESRSAWC